MTSEEAQRTNDTNLCKKPSKSSLDTRAQTRFACLTVDNCSPTTLASQALTTRLSSSREVETSAGVEAESECQLMHRV